VDQSSTFADSDGRVNRPERNEGIMSRLSAWTWKRNKAAVLAFMAAGIAVAAAAGWTAFHFLSANPSKMTVKFQLCVGHEDSRNSCPSESHFVLDVGENTVTDWITKECSNYVQRSFRVIHYPADICNCYVVSVRCTT